MIDNRTFQVGLFHEGFYEKVRYWTIDGGTSPFHSVSISAPIAEMSDAGGLEWAGSRHPTIVGA